MMKPADLRELLGLTRREWARALNVAEKTVQRWEEGNEPVGLASEVMRGIQQALDGGADPKRVGQLVSLGIGGLLFSGLTRQLKGVR